MANSLLPVISQVLNVIEVLCFCADSDLALARIAKAQLCRMRILLVEDHTFLRETTVELFRRHFPEAILGEAASDHEVRPMLNQPWDVVVLDLGLPDGGGFGLIRYIKAVAPACRVLILTAASEKSHALTAVREGADGFVTKRASLDEVLYAIREVLSGSRYFSKSIASEVLQLMGDGRRVGAQLSARELDVLHLTARGLKCAEIARNLSISPKSVVTYRSRLRSKLNTRSNAGLICFALSYSQSTNPACDLE